MLTITTSSSFLSSLIPLPAPPPTHSLYRIAYLHGKRQQALVLVWYLTLNGGDDDLFTTLLDYGGRILSVTLRLDMKYWDLEFNQ